MLMDVNPMFSHFVFPADGVEAKSWTDGFHLARWGPCLREISAIKFIAQHRGGLLGVPVSIRWNHKWHAKKGWKWIGPDKRLDGDDMIVWDIYCVLAPCRLHTSCHLSHGQHSWHTWHSQLLQPTLHLKTLRCFEEYLVFMVSVQPWISWTRIHLGSDYNASHEHVDPLDVGCLLVL